MWRVPIRLFLLPALLVHAYGLQPPSEEQWQELLESGNLERRIASAYRFENHIPSQNVQRRAARLRQTTMAKKLGLGSQLSGQLPVGWTGLSPEGDARVLVFLLDFADHRAETDFPGLTRERVHENIFGNGTPEAQAFIPRESMRNFYHRASNGLLNITGETFGWYHFPMDQEDYVPLDGDSNIEANWSLAREVLLAYDSVIDYSQYDTDGDGYVDALNFIWSGEIGEWSSFWWGYRWSFYNDEAQVFSLDGVRFRDFSWQWVEERKADVADFDPRVINHEFGHLLGLPDLYDYDPEVGPEGGIGGAGIMDSSRSGNFNAYFRWLMGWIEPEVRVVGESDSFTLTPAGQFNSPSPALVVFFETPEGGLGNPLAPFSEMLVVENRQPIGNDGGVATLPSGGLYLWHVDGALDQGSEAFEYDNSSTDRKLIRLIQQDGLGEIERLAKSVDAEDLYLPGDKLSPWTTPAGRSYDFSPSRVILDNIEQHPDSSISLRLSAYDGALVRVSPSDFQLRAVPGLAHPPSEIILQSEGFAGSLSVGPAGILNEEQNVTPMQIPLNGEVADYVFWKTEDKPLHLTHERIVLVPSDESVPPVSIPVQLQVRIPLEDALFFPDGFWETGRHRPWYGQSDVVESPPFAVASGKVGNNQQAYLGGWVQGPGWISFSIKVSSEENEDEVKFQMNGVTELVLSGEKDWQRYTYYTSSEDWVQLRWIYIKDGSNSAGQDQAWIDNFEFKPNYQGFFGRILSQLGLEPDFTSKPFDDGRTLLEHFAFTESPDNYSSLAADVKWPMFEFISGDPFPLLRMSYRIPQPWLRYTPQASMDGVTWYTLEDGSEGVRIYDDGNNWVPKYFADVPIFGYKYVRIQITAR